MINKNLANQQNLTSLEIENIEFLHQERNKLYKCFFDAIKANDRIKIEELKKKYTEGEFLLQRAWGFTQDESYHRFWDIPGCTCPSMDNADRLGFNEKIFSGSCPIHGNFKSV